eukprot:5485812-Prymnesium_polylepis.1
MEGRPLLLVAHPRTRPRVQKEESRRELPARDRKRERRLTRRVECVWLGARPQREVDEVGSAMHREPVERRHLRHAAPRWRNVCLVVW